MSKLLAVPITVLTVALAAAFISPAAATGAVRAVAPGIHAGLLMVAPAVLSNSNNGNGARFDNTPAISGADTGGAARTGISSAGNTPTLSGTQQSSALAGTSNLWDRALDEGHDVATAGRMNCGRFGNGFHGGKHDFTCPNQPFPHPPSS